MSNESDAERLWCDLNGHLAKKPSESCPAATQDEYLIKIQKKFVELITRYPVYSVVHKLELEMWNVLYKTQINTLQTMLHQRLSGIGNGGPLKCSTMEIKLRLVLLLDRASGVYVNLIYQLLQPVSELTWPKVISRFLTDFNGYFEVTSRNKVKHVSDCLDLDMATFCVNKVCNKKIKHSDLNKFSSCAAETDTNTITPRILSRGDRLPSEVMTVTSNLEGCKLNDQDVKTLDDSDEEKDKATTNQESVAFYLDYEAAAIYLIHHCLVHLGDIARYRQQANVAAGYYLWAWAVHPDSGHSFNQLAILEATKPLPKRCIDALFYYYIRAIGCLHQFPAAMNNLSNILLDCLKPCQPYSACNTSEDISGDVVKNEVLSKKLWPRFDNLQVKAFIQFYAVLHLHTAAPDKLIQMASTLFENMNIWTKIELKRNQLVHILCIHFYLIDQYLSDSKSNLLTFQKTTNKALCTLNEHQIGSALLLCLTIRLINWITSEIVFTSKALIASSSSSLSNEHISNILDTKTVDDNLIDEKNTNCALPLHPDQKTNAQLKLKSYRSELVIALNLLFLWFRSITTDGVNAGMKSSYQLTDSLFKLITPAFTEETVNCLNTLIHQYQWLLLCDAEKNCYEDKQTTDISVSSYHNDVQLANHDLSIVEEKTSSHNDSNSDDAGGDKSGNSGSSRVDDDHVNIVDTPDEKRLNVEVHPTSIDWSRLMKIPEIVVLQGFTPLRVPTQRSLCCSSTAYNPMHPFFFIDFCDNELTQSSAVKMDNVYMRKSSTPVFGDNTKCISETERVLCLLTSARYIAQFFPSLLGWIPYSKGDSCDSTEASNCYGSFCVNNRTPPNLKDMFDTHDKKNGRRNNETGQSYRMVLNSLEESVIKVSPLPESYPTSDSSGNYQLPLENSVLQRSTDNISGSCTNIVQSNHSSELVPFNANELSIIPVTQQEDVAKVNLINATSTKLSSSTEMSISNDSVKSSPSSLPSSLLSHIGTPGGLIMNAELAKFIQEQASQVAARQQRFNMSTTTTTTTTTTMVNSNSQQLTSTGGGDGTTGNLVSEASIKSLSTGKTSLTTTLTRLSLSGAFKRDLPPRYAKLLQTELYEKEALENRRNQKQKELNSSLLLIDQPAPLARKESEAPTDLISLLSSSDVKAPIHHEQNVESLELNLSSKQMFHLPNSIDSSMHNPSPNYPSSIPQSLVPANIESSGIPFPSPDFFFRPPITASAAALANLSSSMSMKSYFPTDFQSSSLPPIHPIASSLNQTSFQSNWPTSTTDAYIPPQSHINHFYNPTVTSQHLPFLPMNNNHVNSSHHQFTNLNIPYHPLNLTGFTSPPPPPATCIIEQQVNFSNPIDNSDKSNNNNNS